jgi:hypothetical protein
MKKSFLSLFAAVLAISVVALSAFTKHEFHVAKKTAASKYMIYVSGQQNQVSSYSTSIANATTDEPSDCNNASTLCWFRIDDLNNDNVIDQTDFDASFAALNQHNVSSNSLDDESEITDQLEKKN